VVRKIDDDKEVMVMSEQFVMEDSTSVLVLGLDQCFLYISL